MPLEQHKKTIMGHEYETTFITGSKGLTLLGKVMGYIGKGSSILKNISGANLNSVMNQDDKADMALVVSLVQALPELMDDSFLPFTLEIFQNTMRDGRHVGDTVVFDDVFAGNYTELFYTLGWVIYVNYCKDLKDVFTKALNQVKEMKLPEKIKELSKASSQASQKD